jgi:RHS repeat-associated protein
LAGHSYGAGQIVYGPVGAPLILTGANLGQGGSVRFVGYVNGSIDSNAVVIVTPTQWTSSLIQLTVPSGAVSGLVFITTANGTSAGLPFLVTPGTYSTAYCPLSPSGTQLQITTSSLGSGTVEVAYNEQLHATGGAGTLSWSIVSGSLPGGINLNAATGALSGTPTATATVQLTVRVADSGSPQQTNDATFDLIISLQSSGIPLYNFSISSGSGSGYDAVGNIMAYTDSVTGAWSMTTATNSSGYDSLNRLGAAQATAGPYQGLQASWAYDSFGNRTAENFNAAQGSDITQPVPASTAFTYNANNQVSTAVPAPEPTYDAAGNVTQDRENQYAYDAEGRLCAVNSSLSGLTGYLYDAEGNRVAKGSIHLVMINSVPTLSCDATQNGFTATVVYVLGPSGEQLTELANNSGTWQWAHTNVYAGGVQIATYDGDPSGQTDGSLYFHLTDWLGTRRQSTDYVGNPCAIYYSLPYGNGLAPAAVPCLAPAQDPTEHHFTGKERDAESGNDYFEARYYSSAMGRFLSPDPGWFSAADPTDPQSWNLYSYARNNPFTNIDPDGYDCVYLNNAGTDVDRDKNGNVTGIDTHSNSGECGKNGGYWVDGTFDHGTVYSNSNDVSLTGHTTDNSGNQTSTDAFYTNADTPQNQSLLNFIGYFGYHGTVDMLSLARNHPRIDTIGPQNPLDVWIGCTGSGVKGVSLDVSGIGILNDAVDSAMSGSLNPLFNSGDRLNDVGNAADVGEKGAKILEKTLPVAAHYGKALGWVGAGITVAKAGRDFYNCVR